MYKAIVDPARGLAPDKKKLIFRANNSLVLRSVIFLGPWLLRYCVSICKVLPWVATHHRSCTSIQRHWFLFARKARVNVLAQPTERMRLERRARKSMLPVQLPLV